MLVTYVSPNRSSQYLYAAAMKKAGCLRRFISGFSRFSPRAALPELGDDLRRFDFLQNLYLASLKFRMPGRVSDELGYLSKVWLDRCAEQDARASDIFLFYSGSGLHTLKKLKGTATRSVVEAVTSHVLTQEKLLREEYRMLQLPFRPYHAREIKRRVEEYEQADAVICPSQFSRQSFIDQGMPKDRVFVVPYGLTPTNLSSPPTAPNDVFRVLYVGQIDVRKGLRYLFAAFEALRHPKKELWIVGSGTEQTGIADIPAPQGTRFLGVLKGEELAATYRESHVFVLPTIEDGFGLVLGEALSYGLPIIATVNSGAPDLFQDGEEGFLVPIRSPEAIREKLQRLADSPALLKGLANRVRASDNRQRSWDATCETLLHSLKAIQLLPKVP